MTPRLLMACALLLAPAVACALDVSAGSGAANGCSGTVPRLQADAEAWLEPAPLSRIDDYGGSEYAPQPDDNVGVGVGFAELSAGVRNYCVGLLYREELLGNASRDTLDILYADHGGNPFEPGRTYQALYDTRRLTAEGLRVRRVFDVDSGPLHLRIGLGVSLLKALRGHEESLSGAVTATAADYAVGTASWLLVGSDLSPRDFNPFVGAGNPQGWGFSTDVHIKALIRESTELELVVMDAFGRIYWRDMRRSLRTLDNETIHYDENDNRGAFVNGMDSRGDDEWRIPAKYHLALAQPVSRRVTLLLADDSIEGIHFVSLGARVGTAARFAGATFDLRTQAVSLSARWARFGFSVTSNRWRWQDASALGASLEFATQW